MDPYRHERISESIREELDELIAYEMSDPRVGSATVTEVLISKDYRKAVVRLALVGTHLRLERLNYGHIDGLVAAADRSGWRRR